MTVWERMTARAPTRVSSSPGCLPRGGSPTMTNSPTCGSSAKRTLEKIWALTFPARTVARCPTVFLCHRQRRPVLVERCLCRFEHPHHAQSVLAVGAWRLVLAHAFEEMRAL